MTRRRNHPERNRDMGRLRAINFAVAGRLWQRRPDGYSLLIIALAALGTAHILVRTATHGAAVESVAVTYMSIAANLAEGEGWQDFRGYRLLPWPPLFPALMAALGLVGIEPADAGRLLNAAAFGLIILASGLWLRRTLRSPLLAVGATLVIMVPAPFAPAHFSSGIESDPLFMLFSLLALIWMAPFLSREAVRRPILLAAAFSALAAVTRYAGVPLIFTGVLLLLLRRESPLFARLKYAAVYGIIASLPLAIVLAYNRILFGALLRHTLRWDEPSQPLYHSLTRIVDLFPKGVLPVDSPGWYPYLLWIATGLVIAGVAAVCIRYRSQLSPDSSGSLRPLLPFAVFALPYLTLLVAADYYGRANYPITPRYLMPLYVPLLLAGACLLDRLLHLRAAGPMAGVKWAAAALILAGGLGSASIWTASGVAATARALESGYHNKTYNTAHWDESATIGYLRANPVDARIYCNRFGILHFLLAQDAGINVRGKYPQLARNIPDVIRQINDSGDGTHIVWLYDDVRPYYNYGVDGLRALPYLEVVAELDDGVIFKFSKGNRATHRPTVP